MIRSRRSKDLFDSAHDLIHIVEPDKTIIYINNAWTKILDYSQEEMQGRVIYPADRDGFIQYRQTILKGTNKDAEISTRMLTK